MPFRAIVLVSLFVCSPAAAAVAQTVTTWQPVNSLSVPRAGHVSVRLPDGKVLVAGGTDFTFDQPEFAWATAEVFDPAIGTWSPIAPMQTRRSWAAAAALADGRVLVAGGQHTFGSVFHDSVEIYNPASNTWSPAAAMSLRRAYFTATTLPDGKVLVAGGITPVMPPPYSETTTASAEVYDPVSNTWTPTESMPNPHSLHGAVRLSDGRVLILAGRTVDPATSAPIDTAAVEIYDPAGRSWSEAAPLPSPRGNFTPVVLADDRVLVAGGGSPNRRESHIYDPAANTWSPAAEMLIDRGYVSAVTLADGRVLVAGGEFVTDLPGIPVPEPTGEIYNPVTNAWTPAGTMFENPWYPGMTLLADGRVLVEGGCCRPNPTVSFTSAQIFGPVSCPADVTDRLTTFTSVFVPIPGTPVQLQLVLIGNITTDTITGPLAYRIDESPGAAPITLTSTRCQEFGLRRPYFRISTGADDVLTPGEFRAALLWFYQTVELPITYSSRVLGGIPVR